MRRGSSRDTQLFGDGRDANPVPESCAGLTCCFALGAAVYSSRLLVYGPDIRLAGVRERSDEDKDGHRSRQGFQQEPPWQPGRADDITARIERGQVLGVLISEYRKAAQGARNARSAAMNKFLARDKPEA